MFSMLTKSVSRCHPTFIAFSRRTKVTFINPRLNVGIIENGSAAYLHKKLNEAQFRKYLIEVNEQNKFSPEHKTAYINPDNVITNEEEGAHHELTHAVSYELMCLDVGEDVVQSRFEQSRYKLADEVFANISGKMAIGKNFDDALKNLALKWPRYIQHYGEDSRPMSSDDVAGATKLAFDSPKYEKLRNFLKQKYPSIDWNVAKSGIDMKLNAASCVIV